MKSSKIKKLIVKYITNSISAVELDELSVWLEKPENDQIFYNYVKINYAIDFNMSEFNSEKTKKLLLRRIREDKNIFYRIKLPTVLKYAAVAILFMGIGYFSKQYYFFGSGSNEILIPKEDSITLQLENGNIEIILENGTTEVVDSEGNVVGEQKGTQLVYKDETSVEKLTYNTLSVPYGKQFDLKLSDGTKVKLNAGTSIRYPIKFIKGLSRQVFLEGEAFFDVAKDAKHLFIVNANELNVRVLGTRFNISSYQEDQNINTVLVEGSVSIYKNTSSYDSPTTSLLKPGYQAAWNKSNKHLSIEKTDTSLHTAWVDGKVIFRHLPFKNIIKKLERHYNVVIISRNKELNNEFFTASFDIETIEEVLKTFSINYDIDYTIENNHIIIN